MSGRGPYEVLALSEIATGDRFGLEYACRVQAQPVYLGDNSALCRVLGRFKFLVDTRDFGFGANVLLDGYWEMWLTMIMARVVKPGMVAVDIGANFGYYSILLADLVGPTGHVVSVEPNPVAAATLRRSLTLNGMMARTEIVQAAAGASNEGMARLYVPANEPKNAVLLDYFDHADPDTGAIADVPLWSLDGAIDAIGGSVDVIKIDAEGAEQAIIQGMVGTLERQRPILIVEYNAGRYADPATLLDRLVAIYGACHAITFEGSLVPVSKAQVLNENRGEDWLLFFGQDPAAALPPPPDKTRRRLR